MRSNKVEIFNFFRNIFKLPFLEIILKNLIQSNNFYSNFISKLAPNHYQYQKGSYRKTIINGIKLNLDISDYIGHYLYFGFKDIGFQELIKLSKHKNTIFDIGANIGFTALSMAKSNLVSTKVYAFEPDPFNFNCLIKNLNLNTNLKVLPNQLGLGNVEDKLKLAVVTEDNLGGNRMNASATSNFSWVDISTIDIYCKKNSINKIDLIKIDVEGFELNVLKGGVEQIERNKPTLFIELDDENLKLQNSSAKELLQFLEQYYTNIYDADSKKIITSKDNFQHCHLDIIAIL